jgi:hypothetical protein
MTKKNTTNDESMNDAVLGGYAHIDNFLDDVRRMHSCREHQKDHKKEEMDIVLHTTTLTKKRSFVSNVFHTRTPKTKKKNKKDVKYFDGESLQAKSETKRSLSPRTPHSDEPPRKIFLVVFSNVISCLVC